MLLACESDPWCEVPASGLSLVKDDAGFARSSAPLALWDFGAMLGVWRRGAYKSATYVGRQAPKKENLRRGREIDS